MSSNVSNSVAGSQPQPLQNSNSGAQPAASHPDHRLNAWSAALDAVALNDAAAAHKLFDQVEHGIASPHDAPMAQAVFNDLIQHEAYDVLVDVFKAYNAIRAAQVRAPGEPPFKSALTLQLPADWAPTGPAALQAALQKVQVQRLEVVHPQVDESKFEPLVTMKASVNHGGFFSLGNALPADPEEEARVAHNRELVAEQYDAAVPEAVCDAIVTALQAGTTELVVRGNLARPNMVARALSASPLQSIELGHENRFSNEMSTATADSYGPLMHGLENCSTLRHLVLVQPDLLTLHASVENLARGCPDLQSLNVRNNATRGVDSDLAAFMKTAAQCGKLTEITIKDVPPSALRQEVYDPLRKLTTLTTLNVSAPYVAVLNAADWGAMPDALRFSKSCPSLKHLHLAAPPIATGFGSLIAFSYLKLPQPDDQAMTDEFLLDPTINLENVTMSGVPISHRYLSAMGKSLRSNNTLKVFDISGCLVSAQAAMGLPEALIRNDTLRTGKLPTNPWLYFMVSADQTLHRLGEHFELHIAFNADADAQATARASYEEIRAKLKWAPRATQALLDNKTAAREALTLQVGGVLQMAAPPALASFGFQDIAAGVMPYLSGNAQELRDTVRLSRVGIAADTSKLHKGKQTPASLKAAVQAASIAPVARTTTNTTATTTTTTTTTNGASSVTTTTAADATATPPPDGAPTPKQG